MAQEEERELASHVLFMTSKVEAVSPGGQLLDLCLALNDRDVRTTVLTSGGRLIHELEVHGVECVVRDLRVAQ